MTVRAVPLAEMEKAFGRSLTEQETELVEALNEAAEAGLLTGEIETAMRAIAASHDEPKRDG